ncbi:MAG: MFS transporter [Rhodospirillales bacterium]|nr:MFS transporter [Rhodospirillales bacterium]
MTPARRLLAARAAISLGQGAMGVDFALYARALGWAPARLGAVVGAGMLVGGVLTALAGPLSDRFGRKPFLLAYLLAVAGACAAATLSARGAVVATAAIVAGFGRGAVGVPGLFGAVQQAWLADLAEGPGLGRAFTRNAALGFLATAAGTFVGGMPALWDRFLPDMFPGPLAYRPLFALAAATTLAAILLLAALPEPARPPAAPDAVESRARAEENRLLWRLAGINAVNGVGIGLTGPLLSWWLAARFGVGPGRIGPAVGLVLLGSAGASLLAGRLGARFGLVRVVVAMRALGVGLQVVMPFAPGFGWAMGAYAARTVLNRGTAGQRQAVVMGAVRGHRRGLAASIGGVSTQLPRALGPLLAGLMFGAGWFAAPFLLAAAFQGAYLVLYRAVFRGREGRAA